MAVSSSKSVFSCVAVIFAGVAFLTGCARGLPDPGLNIDHTAKTASIAEAAGPNLTNPLGLEPDTYRDGETIGNAVSAIPFSGQSIAWQNPATGSRGEITSIQEHHSPVGALCRDFTALRTSYDGIRNYSGTTCMNDAGIWQLAEFRAL